MKLGLRPSTLAILVMAGLVIFAAAAIFIGSELNQAARTSDDPVVVPTRWSLPVAELPTFTPSPQPPDSTGPPEPLTSVGEEMPPTEEEQPPTPLPPSMTTAPTETPPPAPIIPPSSTPTSAPPTQPAPSPLIIPAPAIPLPTAIPQQPIPNQVVIRFEPGTSPEQRTAYIQSIGGTVTKQIDALNTVVVDVPAPIAEQPLPKSLAVVASEPDYYVSALDGPLTGPYNDPFFDQQWALTAIGAPEGWAALPADAPTVLVAVIDSGICADHPDLVGRIGAGWDFLEQDALPQDDFGHGCSVAGVIAANPNNGLGIAGVAPNAQIMPLRVLNGQGVGSYSDVAAAIVHAADHGAQIINLSLGGANPSSVLEEAVTYATSRGVIVIAAAGNTGQEGVLYPAAYEPVIAVASVDSDLQRSSFSSYGPQVDLLAPGRDILTTKRDGGYGLVSGTSFAAPHVAGVAAVESGLGNILVLDGTLLSVFNTTVSTPLPTATEIPTITLESASPTAVPTVTSPTTDLTVLDQAGYYHLLYESSDGEIQFYIQNSQSGELRPAFRESASQISPDLIDLAPDGTHVAYVVTSDVSKLFDASIWLADANANTSQVILPASSQEAYVNPLWSPDGQKLAYVRVKKTSTSPVTNELWYYDLNLKSTYPLVQDNSFGSVFFFGKSRSLDWTSPTTLQYYDELKTGNVYQVDIPTDAITPTNDISPTIADYIHAYTFSMATAASASLVFPVAGLAAYNGSNDITPSPLTNPAYSMAYLDKYYTGHFEGEGLHPGVDIPRPCGTEVLAIGAGVIWTRSTAWSDSRTVPPTPDPCGSNLGSSPLTGNYVVIKIDNLPRPTGTTGYDGTIYVIYEHLRSISAPAVNQSVGANNVIGQVGSTGNSDGPHLHFQIDRVYQNHPYWPPNCCDSTATADVDAVKANTWNPMMLIQAHQMTAGVTVYAAPNYNANVSAASERFNIRDPFLYENPIGSQTISSARVPDGWILIVCTEKEFRGKCKDFTQDVPNFGTINVDGTNLDNHIQSLKVGYLMCPVGTSGDLDGQGICLPDDPPPPPPGDTTLPFGSWTSPSNHQTISSSVVTLSANATDNSGGSGVKEVHFNAKWNDVWHGITVDSSSPYTYSWNWCASGVPNGEVELGLEVWDNAGNKWVYSEHVLAGNIHVTKSSTCPQDPEPPPPQDAGVYLWDDTGHGLIVWGDVPSLGDYEWNDRAVSIQTVGGYQYVVYWDSNYSGSYQSGSGSSDLGTWKKQISSIRVRRTENPAFTLYERGDYNGEPWASDRTIYDLGHWGKNDWAESLRVSSGYQIIACEHSDFKGTCGRATGPASFSDINALSQGLRRGVSSVRVCSGACPPGAAAPTVLSPQNGAKLNANTAVVLQWYGGTEFYAEVWGGALGSTLQYGWTSATEWNLGQLAASTQPYNWHVKASNGFGESGWASGSFYVQTPTVEVTSAFVAHPAGSAGILSVEPAIAADSIEIDAEAPEVFDAGDAIHLYIRTSNNTGNSQAAFFRWLVTDPLGRPVGALSWEGNLTTPNGTVDWYLPTAVPPDALTGYYIFKGQITYNGKTTEQGAYFYVNGPTAVLAIETYTTDALGSATLSSSPTALSSDVQPSAVKTEFELGDTIQLHFQVYNNQLNAVTAHYKWQVLDPLSRAVPALQWEGDLSTSAASMDWSLERTIPGNLLKGYYTFTGTVTYNGRTQSVPTVFYVDGLSLPNPPTLLHPADNSYLNTRSIAFSWQSPNADGQTGYVLRLSRSPDPAISPWLVNTSLGNIVLSYNYTFPSDGTFYWHMQTNSSVGTSDWITRRLVIDTVQPTGSIFPGNNAYLNSAHVLIQATVSDSGSGVASVDFYAGYGIEAGGASLEAAAPPLHPGSASPSEITSQDYWHYLGADTDGANGWTYDWDATTVPDQTGVALFFYVNDRAGNYRGVGNSYNVLDRKPPTSSISFLPDYSSVLLDIYWYGSDEVAGIASYDIQVRDNSGAWTDWQKNVSTTGANFAAVEGHTYAFRSRARDWAGNVEAWPAVPDQQTTIVGPPPNDDITDAVVVSSLPYSNTQITFGAMSARDDPSLSCVGGKGFKTVWYRVVPTLSGTLSVNTLGSSYNTVLGVWKGTRGALMNVGCSDDSGGTMQSSVDVLAQGGISYYIEIGSYYHFPGDTGSLTLSVSLDPLPQSGPILATPATGGTLGAPNPSLTWYSVLYANSYQLQIDNDPLFGSPELDITTTSLSSPPYYPLPQGIRYYWRVRGLNAHNYPGPWSLVRNFTIDLTAPPAPTPAAPANRSNVTTLVPRFTWGAAAGATQYRLQVDDNSNFSTPVVNQTLTGLTGYTTPAGLLSYGTYFWRVQAMDAAGNTGLWSATYQVTLTILSAPANAAHLTTLTPTLTWYAASSATGYTVQIDILDAAGQPTPVITAGPLPSTLLSYRPVLNPGEYRWRVQVNGVWTPYWTFTITPSTPPAPVPISPTVNWLTNSSNVGFQWTAVPGAASYQLQIDNALDFRSPAIDVTQTDISYTVGPIPEGRNYWRVRAINDVGMAGLWSAARIFTVDLTAPAAPVLLAPADQSGTTLLRPRFVWQAAAGANHYHVQIANNETFVAPVVDQDMGSLTAYTVPFDLTPGVPYWWHVWAGDAAGNNGPYSAAFRVIISGTPAPGRPALLAPALNALSDNPVGLTWGMALGAQQYQVQIDNNSTFASPEFDQKQSGTSLNVTLAAPDGRFYWRLRAINSEGIAGLWSAAWYFTLDTTAPNAPRLLAPANGSATALLSPRLAWQVAPGATQYRVQWAATLDALEGSAFTSLGNVTSATITLPGYGYYYWRVQAGDSLGHWGAWSDPFVLGATLLRSPVNNSYTTNLRPTLMWSAKTGALRYGLQVFGDPALTLLVVDQPNLSRLATSYLMPGALPYGHYYWRLCADLGGGCTSEAEWSLPWMFTVTPAPPLAPVLGAPQNGALFGTMQLTFYWNKVVGAADYQIQVDADLRFANPIFDDRTNEIRRESRPFDSGRWYWRVRAFNNLNVPGPWSAAWSFTIDAVAPGSPTLIYPADGASITNPQLTFTWNAAAGAARYEVQIDTGTSFTQPPIALGAVLSYRSPTPLSRGTYYWQVRALDAAGNVGAWSETRHFEVVAGYTVAGAKAPTPTAIPAVTEAPTPEPTVLPTDPSAPVLLRVESDDAAVQQAGTWTAHDTAAASGGRYLFSSGSPDDSLMLAFSGTALGVIVVQHPALGSLTLEVDGAALQTVSTAASEAVFGAEIRITGLAAGPHTLRVLPASGTIAIDAFEVEAVIAPPAVPTPAPTEPPVTPEIPTAVPTELPTLTPKPPTATPLPLPVLLPVVETFDSGQGWTAGGAWRWDTLSAHSGAGWFADSTARGQLSTLTFGTPLDLRAALAPQLVFWQQAALASGDLFAVDLSLDGGLSWLVLYTQSALVTAWTPRTFDLSPYRGAVVLLRFRLDTMGTLAEGETTFGVAVDDLLIQEAPPLPTAIPTEPPLPTEVPAPTAVPTDLPTVLTPIEVPTEAPVEVPTEAPTEAPVPSGTEVAAP